MKIQEARELGDQLATLIRYQRYEEARDLLFPKLAERTPFRLLDVIGERLGNGLVDGIHVFLDQIAARQTMGGWVVIASTLRQQLSRNLPDAFEHCHEFVIAADVWYASDTFGERVPGPALTMHFDPALALLTAWREDHNQWIRRIVGVAVHYWAKQSKGKESLLPQARALLDLLDPLFEEPNTEAIKGIGWGLKTLGKYYPELTAEWLSEQAARPHRALMLRKATTYLPADLRPRAGENLK